MPDRRMALHGLLKSDNCQWNVTERTLYKKKNEWIIKSRQAAQVQGETTFLIFPDTTEVLNLPG